MMKDVRLTVVENRPLTRDVVRMRLRGDLSAVTAPGQFVNVKVDGLYLRRPLSVCDLRGDVLTLVFRIVGNGTRRMADLPAGAELSVLTGLGNGYDLSPAGPDPLLIGGGVGTPPLYWLAGRLRENGCAPQVVLGFNTGEDVFYEKEFSDLGCSVTVTTADGSYGRRGFVTDALPERYSYVYACGPEPMLKAVFRAIRTSGQFSFEERMGCGFGACMGCSCRTVAGPKRICREGPVLKKEEILW